MKSYFKEYMKLKAQTIRMRHVMDAYIKIKKKNLNNTPTNMGNNISGGLDKRIQDLNEIEQLFNVLKELLNG